jgi:hypothetical protein
MTESNYTGISIAVARARAELAVIADFAPAPKRGRAILDAVGVSLADFTEPDCAIIAGILFAVGEPKAPAPPVDVIAVTIRDQLRAEGLYDQTDPRSFLGGMRWSPGAIAALLTRCRFDPDALNQSAHSLIALRQGGAR